MALEADCTKEHPTDKLFFIKMAREPLFALTTTNEERGGGKLAEGSDKFGSMIRNLAESSVHQKMTWLVQLPEPKLQCS
jgi:hypothetical protein